MQRTHFFIAAILLCATVTLRAQDADDVDRSVMEWSPKNVSWREVYKYKTVPNFPKDPARKAFFDKIMAQYSRPSEKQISRNGNDRYEKVTWENGRVTESWYLDGVLVFQTLSMKPDSFYVESAEGNAYFNPPQDFSELRWATKGMFEKTEMLRNGPASVFSTKYAVKVEQGYVLAAGGEAKDSGSGVRVVKVDKKTHLPVVYQDGALTCEYIFDSSAPGPLSPPAKIRDLIKSKKRT